MDLKKIAKEYGATESGVGIMQMIANWGTDFFDDGLTEGSGQWGENLALYGARWLDKKRSSMGSILNGIVKAGLMECHNQQHPLDSETWWTLTAKGAECARLLVNEEPTGEPVEVPEAPAEPISEQARANYLHMAKTAPSEAAKAYWTAKAEG